ncbi:MAG: hypothetical protein HY089_13390 [Ignavibacteriales bacterium]|nr:hypothetical protein [Ignavibacteriales bacterium]
MKIDWAFLRIVFFCVTGTVLVAAYPLSHYGSEEINKSVIASGLASFFHLMLGYIAIELGFDKSNTTFLKIVLGGTVFRMLMLVGVVFILIKVYHFHSLSLMISLLAFYVINLILEIYFLQKKVSLKN